MNYKKLANTIFGVFTFVGGIMIWFGVHIFFDPSVAKLDYWPYWNLMSTIVGSILFGVGFLIKFIEKQNSRSVNEERKP